MTKTIKLFGLSLLMAIGQIAFGQSNQDKAMDKMQQALEFEEEGKYDPAIKLLQDAQKLDPQNITYPYEIAYAYYAKDDYTKAAKLLKGLLKKKDADDLIYQLLGNCYDDLGNSAKAITTYNKGLSRFPNSGELYLELAEIQIKNKDFEKALYYNEMGIKVDPVCPSNYYWASTIYCSSTEEVWGMIYGEIFMNLERNTKRTFTISKLLFDTYKSQIKFKKDSATSISFCKNMTMNIKSLTDTGGFKLPFGMIYEQNMMLSVLQEKKIDLASLDRIRTRFVENYYKNGNNKKYPNVLFAFQDTILKAGHMEAYNHWLLMKGDDDAFATWKAANQDKWDSFEAWFKEHKIMIDETNKFGSGKF